MYEKCTTKQLVVQHDVFNEFCQKFELNTLIKNIKSIYFWYLSNRHTNDTSVTLALHFQAYYREKVVPVHKLKKQLKSSTFFKYYKQFKEDQKFIKMIYFSW